MHIQSLLNVNVNVDVRTTVERKHVLEVVWMKCKLLVSVLGMRAAAVTDRESTVESSQRHILASYLVQGYLTCSQAVLHWFACSFELRQHCDALFSPL